MLEVTCPRTPFDLLLFPVNLLPCWVYIPFSWIFHFERSNSLEMTSHGVSLAWLLLSFRSVSLDYRQQTPGILKLTEPEIALFINSCKSVFFFFPVVFFILNKRIIIHLGTFSQILSSVTSCFFLSLLPSYIFVWLPHLVNSTTRIFLGFVISSHSPLWFFSLILTFSLT